MWNPLALVVGNMIVRGQATIPGGQAFVSVTDARVTPVSRILATAKSPSGQLWIDTQIGGSFVINMPGAPKDPLNVDYVIFN